MWVEHLECSIQMKKRSACYYGVCSGLCRLMVHDGLLALYFLDVPKIIVSAAAELYGRKEEGL